jgi:hypothetical protein
MSDALLQLPGGRVVERIPLPDPPPPVIEHDGVRWRRSHQCISGVAYVRTAGAAALEGQRRAHNETGSARARRTSQDKA